MIRLPEYVREALRECWVIDNTEERIKIIDAITKRARAKHPEAFLSAEEARDREEARRLRDECAQG